MRQCSPSHRLRYCRAYLQAVIAFRRPVRTLALPIVFHSFHLRPLTLVIAVSATLTHIAHGHL